MSTTTPSLLLKIHENDILAGAKAILAQIRPEWSADKIRFKFFTDGITNKLVGCWLTNSIVGDAVESINQVANENILLIRIYGNNTELLIDRDAETKNIQLLQTYGFAPSLYATFQNGICYEYVKGITLTPESVASSNIWPLIAQQMARMHRVQLKPEVVSQTPMLLEKCKKFFELVPDQYHLAAKQERRCKLFPATADLQREFTDLYTHLESLQNQLVFCHNDLLLGNIIYTESEEKVTFIDFEYAALNFQAFDIGNHFTEYAGIDNIDYNRYPSKSYQLQWLRVYLETFEDKDVDDGAVERLYVHVNKFALASHYLWFLWALIQAEHSSIDFDFLGFAEQRFNEYNAKKNAFLSLTIPS